MLLEITSKGKTEKIHLEETATVKDLLKLKDINTETVLVKVNNTIVTLDEKLKTKDKIELMHIVSRG